MLDTHMLIRRGINSMTIPRVRYGHRLLYDIRNIYDHPQYSCTVWGSQLTILYAVLAWGRTLSYFYSRRLPVGIKPSIKYLSHFYSRCLLVRANARAHISGHTTLAPAKFPLLLSPFTLAPRTGKYLLHNSKYNIKVQHFRGWRPPVANKNNNYKDGLNM